LTSAVIAPLRIDVSYHGPDDRTAALAHAAEECGIGGFFVPEGTQDPFISLTLASASTSTLQLGTGVSIAFGRTPMSMAYSAYHLHRVSGGRTILGLGSQIKAHIAYRYGMPWSRPAARMREYVAALRSIWHSWQTGEPLDFRGEFYTHTLMPPLLSPGPLGFDSPQIWLGAVGPKMVEAAGAVADGLIAHPLLSSSYLRDVLGPGVTRSRAGAGNSDRAFTLAAMVMVASGRTEQELDAAVAGTRRQIGFYASTPAYVPVLAHHGLSALHGEARSLTKAGRWDELASLIDDSILNTFAVVGDVAGVRSELVRRFGGLADRVILSLPYPAADELSLAIAAG
jgi:probable F420-dependent oxidoreductase